VDRDALMTALRERLRRIESTGDLTAVCGRTARSLARSLARALRDEEDDLGVLHLLGWYHWYRHKAVGEPVDRKAAVARLTPCFTHGTSPLPEPLLAELAEQAALSAKEHLQRIAETADAARLSDMVRLWRRILDAVPAGHPDHAAYLVALGDALQARFEQTGDVADLDEAIRRGQEAVAATPAYHPRYSLALTILANALRSRFEQAGDIADLHEAIRRGQEAVDAAPRDHPCRAEALTVLGAARYVRFEQTGTITDLHEAIRGLHEAVEGTCADHPKRPVYLSILGNVLRARFERTGEITDLDEAIRRGREAVDTTPTGHPKRAMHLTNLGVSLQVRFERTGEIKDLDEAIQRGREAVDTTPIDDPYRTVMLQSLGNALLVRADLTGSSEDLEEALRRGQEAVEATPAHHPKRATHLGTLGNALWARAEQTGEITDLDEAIRRGREAVDTTPADHVQRAEMLNILGRMLGARAERTGSSKDLDEAIQKFREAVRAIPDKHFKRHPYLGSLGSALWARFERTGSGKDLDEAIQRLQEAVEGTSADHSMRAGQLNNLGNALQARFTRTGDITDLDAAIRRFHEAVDATPAEYPKRAAFLNNLGNALWARFERTGSSKDLDEAIRRGQEAVDATPADHPNRALHLNNLGNALQARFTRTGDITDLDAAIQRFLEAVDATPTDHPKRVVLLNNLGNALQARSWWKGEITDLDAAIKQAQEAVDATPADHPKRAAFLNNLGNALQARFTRTGDITDLDAAIQRFHEAVDATPTDHPNRATHLFNLGNALQIRFLARREEADSDAAVSRYADAAEVATASPAIRIRAARDGAALAASRRPGLAADLLEKAVRLLPQVAPRRLARSDQQHAIGTFAGLAADAAALALAAPGRTDDERAVRALRLLEAARAVLLSQTLHTRSDLTDLRARHPVLAARFIELRDLLDQPTDEPAPTQMTGSPADSALTGDRADPGAHDRHHLAERFDTLLRHIRSLDGFESFALPPTTEQLVEQARSGPVVVFNISRHRSDALLLTGEGVTSLAMPALDHQVVTARVRAFHQALRTAADGDAALPDRIAAQATLKEVLRWLWDAAAEPVLSALGYDRTPAEGRPWPRVWWAPGGLLGQLPIHAAGHHDDPPGPGRRTVLDRVVSSYTPTVGALRHARQRGTAPPAPQRGLIVAMATTPGLPEGGRLPNVEDEVALFQAHFPDLVLLAEPKDGQPADSGRVPTLGNVLQHLADCTIAHFACHGVSDPIDPSLSRLLLHDHRDAPLTVTALAPVVLDKARLAYLSACSTAVNTDTRLQDEAIHLASAFQLAGFPHVIGTLWPINDAVAVTIADTFYTTLTVGDGVVDTEKAASALHRAIRAARDAYPRTPSLWAAYIHVGA
jgi:Uncharacterized protein conserved in bacteria